MEQMSKQRIRGYTLVELLVVLAIMAVILGLFLIAISRVREANARAQSMNNLKQITLALHHFGDKNNGRLPSVGEVPAEQPGRFVFVIDRPKRSLFVRLLPYIDQPEKKQKSRPTDFALVSLYISPADPTAAELTAKGKAVISYGCNGQAFLNEPRIPTSFADGMSNTIAFGEHYAKCGFVFFHYWEHNRANRRPSFADTIDLGPINSEIQNNGEPQYPRASFQVSPSQLMCNPYLAQTPHSSGMLTAMMDGSVRTIAPNISPTTFWAAVTPSAGDILGSDW
jgi:prepilin-type N-terminal cleavage/methylation domain-containing protein